MRKLISPDFLKPDKIRIKTLKVKQKSTSSLIVLNDNNNVLKHDKPDGINLNSRVKLTLLCDSHQK